MAAREGLNDEELLEEYHRTGSDEVFARIYERFQPRVAAFVKAVLKKTPQDVDDVVADTFLRLMERLKSAPPPAGPAVMFVRGVAKSVLEARGRKATPQSRVVVEPVAEPVTEPVEEDEEPEEPDLSQLDPETVAFLESLPPLKRARFMRSVEDARLIERFKAGDKRAFDELFNHYKWVAYRVAKRVLHDKEDAKELVTIVFLKVNKSLARFQERSSFFTWLYRVTVNTAIDVLRDKKAKEQREVRQGEKEAAAEQAANTKAEKRKTVLKVLLDVIQQLPPKQRDAIYLRIVKQMKYKDMADELGVPIGTVMSRLFYAQKNIRRIYAEKRGEKPVEKPKQKPPMSTRPKRGRPPKQPQVNRRGGYRRGERTP